MKVDNGGHEVGVVVLSDSQRWKTGIQGLHGLQAQEVHFPDKNIHLDHSDVADQAKRRAEVARLSELQTLKGHVETVVKLKGLDIETIQQHYTV